MFKAEFYYMQLTKTAYLDGLTRQPLTEASKIKQAVNNSTERKLVYFDVS